MKYFKLACSIIFLIAYSGASHAGFLDDAINAIKQGYQNGRMNANTEVIKRNIGSGGESKKINNANAVDDELAFEGDEYSPHHANAADFNKWLEAIKPNVIYKSNDGTKGLYSKDVNSVTITRILSNGRDGALIDAISNGVGAVFPVYEWYLDQKNHPTVRVNWDLTTQRHEQLAKIIGLKLLPLSDTKIIHENIIEEAIKSGGKDSIMNGRLDVLLKNVEKFPSYIFYNFNLKQFQNQSRFLYKNVGGKYELIGKSLDDNFYLSQSIERAIIALNTSAINVLPTIAIRHMNAVGEHEKYSGMETNGCEFIDINSRRKMISTVTSTQQQTLKILNELINLERISNQKINFQCPVEFKKIGIPSYIESERLN